MSNQMIGSVAGRAIGMLLYQERERGVLARMRRSVADAWSAYRSWSEARRATRHLTGLDDRLLRDIGVSRSEINRMVYGPRADRMTDHDGR